MMKVVIAIDSFKGSLSSLQAGEAAAEGIHRVFHIYNPPFCERHQCAMKRLGKLSLF